MLDAQTKGKAYGLVALLKKFFLRRDDQFPVLAPWGSHCPATTSDLDAVLLTHILGEETEEAQISLHTSRGLQIIPGRFRVGLYCLMKDGKTPLIILDFDAGNDHDAPLADPLQDALSTLEHAYSLGLAAYLEQSGSGAGWHIWIFPSEPISFEKARLLGLGLTPRAARLKSGGYAMAAAGIGIEVFPKSWQGRGEGKGAAMWLPWWSGAPAGANLFYKKDGDHAVEYLPEFAFTSLTAIDSALSTLPELSYWKGRPEAKSSPSSPSKGKKKASEGEEGESPSKDILEGPDVIPEELEASPGKEWREQIFEILNLDKFYSPFLTGKKSGSQWLECRDFRSQSGDLNPSAGVSDGEGELPRGVWHSFKDGLNLSPFDYLIQLTEFFPEVGCKTFGDAARKIAKLTGLPYPKRNKSEETSVTDRRPLINVSGQQLKAIVEQSWTAIHRASEKAPLMFRRAGSLVTVEQEELKAPIVQEISEAAMRLQLSDVAQWYRLKGSGEGEKLEACFPPKEVYQSLLARHDKKIPALDLVSNSPIFSPEGEVCFTPGYNASGKVWLTNAANVGLKFPEPTKENALAAVDFLLNDFLHDFKFAAPCDRSHALEVLMLPAVRTMISGATPFHDVNSPVQRVGKSLFVSVVTSVYLGSPVVGQGLPLKEEEVAKTLIAELIQGRPFIFFDNGDNKQRRVIDSGNLEGALTATEWTARELGKTNMVSPVAVRAVWFITGVNLEFKKGLMGRRVRIRLDPRMEDPSKRTGFKHPKILEWTKKNRALILTAIFTIIRYYLSIPEEERPVARTLGGYEDWAQLMGGILAAVEVPGFLEHFEDPEEQVVDSGADEWEEFIEVWWKEYAFYEQSVAKLNELAAKHGYLEGLRGDKSKHSQAKRLGSGLKKIRGRIFSGRRVEVSINTHTKNAEYALEDLAAPSGRDRKKTVAPPANGLDYSAESDF